MNLKAYLLFGFVMITKGIHSCQPLLVPPSLVHMGVVDDFILSEKFSIGVIVRRVYINGGVRICIPSSIHYNE